MKEWIRLQKFELDLLLILDKAKYVFLLVTINIETPKIVNYTMGVFKK